MPRKKKEMSARGEREAQRVGATSIDGGTYHSTGACRPSEIYSSNAATPSSYSSATAAYQPYLSATPYQAYSSTATYTGSYSSTAAYAGSYSSSGTPLSNAVVQASASFPLHTYDDDIQARKVRKEERISRFLAFTSEPSVYDRYSYGQQAPFLGDGNSLARQEQRIAQVSGVVASVNSAFPEARSSLSRQRSRSSRTQPSMAYPQRLAGLVLTEAGSWAQRSPRHERSTLDDDKDAKKLSDSITSPASVFDGSIENTFHVEPLLKDTGADASEEESFQEKERKTNEDDHTMEVSIRRVLSSSPQYAEAIVVAFNRRLRGITPRNRDASDLPALLASAFQRLYDHSEYEAIDNESTSAGKRTTDSGVRARTSSTVIPAGSIVPSQNPVSLKREREKDEKNPQKPSKSKKPCHIMSGKHWLCPYGVRYQTWAIGACRTPTKFRSFSELKLHLRSRHCISSQDGEGSRRPELYMSDQQWNDIEIVANEASKKRPKQGTEASFEKQLGMFRAVWSILFPDAGSGPKSPFCEDFIVDEIGMLSDSIFDSRSQQAFERGDISSPNEYRANRAEFTESMQQLFAIVADYRPEIADLVQDLVSSTASGIIRGHQMALPESSVDEGPGPSRTVADALIWESAESSELTASTSRSGSGKSPQTSSSYSVSNFAGGLKFDNQEPQQGIEPTMLQLNTEPAILTPYLNPKPLHSESVWSPNGTGYLYTTPESSQSMNNRHSPASHTAPSSDPATSHQLQESETYFLGQMMEGSMVFDTEFDFKWKEGKLDDPASTSAAWGQLPFFQSDEDTEDPWQEFFNMSDAHM